MEKQQMTRDEKVENIRADVMTIREVMDELRISRQYLYRLKANGVLIP